MKKLYTGLVGVIVAHAMALQANAADFFSGPGGYKETPYAAVTWSGFYAGVNLGYGWSTQNDQLACTSTACTSLTGGVPFGGVSPDGWLGGVQLGYNYQGFGFAPLVVGIETDAQPSSVYGQGSDKAGDFYHSRLESLGTVRGRVGYSFDCALVYFTGGFAWGSMLNEANQANTSGADFLTNPTVTGYVLGGGVEYKFWRDLAVKVEYQYVNFGRNNPSDITGTITPPSYYANGGTVRDDAFNTVRVGLNWWPFWRPEPLK